MGEVVNFSRLWDPTGMQLRNKGEPEIEFRGLVGTEASLQIILISNWIKVI